MKFIGFNSICLFCFLVIPMKAFAGEQNCMSIDYKLKGDSGIIGSAESTDIPLTIEECRIYVSEMGRQLICPRFPKDNLTASFVFKKNCKIVKSKGKRSLSCKVNHIEEIEITCSKEPKS